MHQLRYYLYTVCDSVKQIEPRKIAGELLRPGQEAANRHYQRAGKSDLLGSARYTVRQIRYERHDSLSRQPHFSVSHCQIRQMRSAGRPPRRAAIGHDFSAGSRETRLSPASAHDGHGPATIPRVFRPVLAHCPQRVAKFRRISGAQLSSRYQWSRKLRGLKGKRLRDSTTRRSVFAARVCASTLAAAAVCAHSHQRPVHACRCD